MSSLPINGQICKDKDEAEVWFVGLKALIARGNYPKWRSESRGDSVASDSTHSRTRRSSPSIAPFVRSSDLSILLVFSFIKFQ